jgi:hypothetical protein
MHSRRQCCRRSGEPSGSVYEPCDCLPRRAELDPPAPQRAGSRRRTFVGAATVAAGAVAAGAGIDHALVRHLTAPGPPKPAGTLTLTNGAWQPVVASGELPEGAVHAFTLGSISGFVERTGGRLRAVSGTCTHQGCKLAFAARPARLVCPATAPASPPTAPSPGTGPVSR